MTRTPKEAQSTEAIRPLGLDEIESIAGAGASGLAGTGDGNTAAPAAADTATQPAGTPLASLRRRLAVMRI